MKFKIERANFFCREELNGTLSLIVMRTNQVIYFNKTGRLLLDHCDEWTDLDDFIDTLNYPQVSRQKLYSDFESLLFELDVYGLADLGYADLESTFTGCRKATLANYAKISAFLLNNAANPQSCAVTTDEKSLCRASVYFRIRNKAEAYILHETDGQLDALISVSRPNWEFGYTVISIDSVVYSSHLSNDECFDALKSLIAFSADYFRADYSKLRYSFMNPRQIATRDALLRLGFTQTAIFEREVHSSVSMVLYDLML